MILGGLSILPCNVFVRSNHQNNYKVVVCRSLSNYIENTFSLNGFRSR